jgi:hypothetical protein
MLLFKDIFTPENKIDIFFILYLKIKKNMCDDKEEFSDNEYEYADEEPTQHWIYHMRGGNSYYNPLFLKQKDGREICVRKVKKGNVYKKCKTEVINCKRCFLHICPMKTCIPQYMMRSYAFVTPSKPHDKCFDCNTTITCCPTGICHNCQKNHYYDMITDKVAIGSYQAPYDPFDLVINLDYPENKVKYGEIVHVTENNKHIIKCGYQDCSFGGGLTYDKLDELLNKIDELKNELKEEPNILFHCYAGVSRSSTVAIAYLAKTYNKTTKEVYKLAQEKRPRINPNSGFRKLIGLSEDDKDMKRTCK